MVERKRKKKSRKKMGQPRPRAYDSSSRIEKSKAVSRKIIQTLIELLAEKKGDDVSFLEISRKSKVPVRTIFRLFKDKVELHKATDAYVSTLIAVSVSELAKYDFVTFTKNVFELYDRHEGLVMAYLFSPFGRQAREILRRRFNQVLKDRILKERKLKADPEREAKLAIVVSLVNARLWYDVRNDFGMSGKDIGKQIAWALETLLRDLEIKNVRAKKKRS